MQKSARSLLEEIAEDVVVSLDYEFVDLEYGKEGENWALRVFIDHPGGIGLDDCEKVSRFLSKELDAKDPIPHRYTLEVSSPGLDRPLRRESDFERFKGHQVVIKSSKAVAGRRKSTGLLLGLRNNDIVLAVDDNEILFPRESVSSVRLVPQLGAKED